MSIYPEGSEPGGRDSIDQLAKKLSEFCIENIFVDPDGFSVFPDGNTIKTADTGQRMLQKILGAAQGGLLSVTLPSDISVFKTVLTSSGSFPSVSLIDFSYLNPNSTSGTTSHGDMVEVIATLFNRTTLISSVRSYYVSVKHDLFIPNFSEVTDVKSVNAFSEPGSSISASRDGGLLEINVSCFDPYDITVSARPSNSLSL